MDKDHKQDQIDKSLVIKVIEDEIASVKANTMYLYATEKCMISSLTRVLTQIKSK